MTATGRRAHAIRPPRLDDYTALVEWIPDGPAARRWAGPELRWPQDGPGLALALHRGAATPLALVDEHDRLIGFGEYYPQPPDRVRLARLIVDPARRGQRLVDELTRALINHARQKLAFETIELGVFADNEPAVRAYRRLGFSPVAESADATILTMQRTRGPSAGIGP